MAKQKTNTLLLSERARCTFNTKDMANVILSTSEQYFLSKIKDILENNEAFKGSDLWWMSSSERYLRACKEAEELVNIIRKEKLMDSQDLILLLQMMSGEDMFLHLHFTMFIPTLETMATDEQRNYWVPLAKNFKILGTYAQTELGHGSNVAGMETTADYDSLTESWVLNTPTITSMKWWPGGLGKSCTHCILMARLRIRGVDNGVHPFIIQIRDLTDHRTLPGVRLCHLGQKLGYNGVDNGSMELKDYRIPRNNLLMRYCHVDSDGNFSKHNDQRFLYATMTFTRKQLILAAGIYLAKSLTVAIRYSAIRRQFILNPAVSVQGTESPVIDYTSQQFSLFPLIAIAVAYRFMSVAVNNRYLSIMEQCRNGNYTGLMELHAITSSLKASTSITVADGIETCRRCCGGNGYMLAAGIPLHFTSYAPHVTFEGDYVVLCIQAGRILLRVFEAALTGSTNPQFMSEAFRHYFTNIHEGDSHPICNISWNNLDSQLAVLEKQSFLMVSKAARKFSVEVAVQNKHVAFDSIKVEIIRVVESFATSYTCREFQNTIKRTTTTEAVKEVLTSLCSLFSLHHIYKNFGEFVATNCLNGFEYDRLLDEIKILLRKIRPNAVSLVDSFSFPDYLLNSAIGSYHGNVYEELADSRNLERLNDTDVGEAYYKHIQYILHPERKQLQSKM